MANRGPQIELFLFFLLILSPVSIPILINFTPNPRPFPKDVCDPSTAPTQPFTDSAEVRRRAGIASPEPRDRDQSAASPLQPTDGPIQPGGWPRQHALQACAVPSRPPAVSTPLDFPTEELAEALANASLTTSPNARLVFACPTNSSLDGPGSVIIPLPKGIGGWDTIGVIQRTCDVDFVIDFPFWIQSEAEPLNWKFEQLKCRLYFDPTNDDCLLINESSGHVYLTRLATTGSDLHQTCLTQSRRCVISPGVWRVSIFEDRESRQHLFDFCLLRRQFIVDISNPPTAAAGTSAKHPLSGDEELAVKRRRLEGDVSEIVLAPAANPLQQPSDASGIAPPNTTAGPSLGTNTSTRRQISKPGIPLLDLQDGEIAIIKSIPLDDKEPKTGALATADTMVESYDLRRIGGIANTAASSVFIGQHSELPVPVVAKVIKYGGMSSHDLVKCAQRWQAEKEILDRLRHRNIVSLRAFDSRLFAVYLERLPPSLHRGAMSPFQVSDAFIILHDISSALAYLDTQNIAHNDIKPANITYSRERGAVIIDFEMATSTTGDPSSGGTPWYLPPEFVLSSRNRGIQGDMWALGVTLLYVLGKIRLPEKTVQPWRIYEVADRTKEARRKMEDWLHSVAVEGQGLDCTDQVQGLVYEMLEKEPTSRLRPEQVSDELSSTTG